MGQLPQEVEPRNNSRPPEFKNPFMKEPQSFDGTQAHKLRGFIQCRKLIFHNSPESFLYEKKKALYSTSFFTGKAGKGAETCLSNTSHEYPSYLLDNWNLFNSSYSLFLVIPINSEKLKKSWII
ncbi:hypothetical protein O181_007768 [Austropuccinia psidii MF-1]|uniref:Uncharacterized protein n=1 Tax=Austropuccinia psidii MF-1 TaxID=1389203 RepID=A0A9Q3GHX1_9BASI|nr:hypothetical protein [Austropuccinia psidii MF-1]